jgi:hypothetical protein
MTIGTVWKALWALQRDVEDCHSCVAALSRQLDMRSNGTCEQGSDTETAGTAVNSVAQTPLARH